MLRRRHKKVPEVRELELTTFLNVLVVLISFLLVTAVFSRLSIQELKLPTAGSGGAAKPHIVIEVIVRKRGLEVGDGKRVVTSMAKSGDQYDVAALSKYLQKLKGQYSDKMDATLLVEPDVSYDDVIRVMDAIKVARIIRTGEDGREQMHLLALFPDLSIGDAP